MRRTLLAASLLATLLAPLTAFGQAPPAVPALPDQERRTSYSITGSTCACAVNFALYGDGTDVDAWLQVWVNGVRYLSTDSTHGWSLSSVTGTLSTIPRPITDAVLTFNAVQTGTVQIVGARRPRQLSQFTEGRGVAARDLNQRFTDITAIERELWDKTNDLTGRGLFFPPGNTTSTMPTNCAGQVLGFAGNFTPLCMTLPLSSVTAPGSFIDPTKAPYNMVADGATDQSSELQAAVNAAEALGFAVPVIIPQNPANGNAYCIKSPVTLHQFGDVVMGSAEVVLLSTCHSDNTIFTLAAGTNRQVIQNLTFQGHGGLSGDTASATQPLIQNNGNGNIIRHVRAIGGGSAFIVNSAGNEEWVSDIHQASGVYGNAIFLDRGGGYYRNINIDQSAPTPNGCTFSNAGGVWAPTTSYTCGQAVSLNNFLIELQNASCTSGGSSPTIAIYGVNFSDGTCSWQLVSPNPYYSIQVDTSASDVDIVQLDAVGPGIGITNSLSGTAPVNVRIIQTNALSYTSPAIDIAAGNKVVLIDAFASSSCNGCNSSVRVQSTFTGNFQISHSRVPSPSNISSNIFIGGGATGTIDDVIFSAAAAASVTIQGSTTGFTVSNTHSTNGAPIALSGTADRIKLINNECGGGSVTCFTSTSSGTHNTFVGNGDPSTTIGSLPSCTAAVTGLKLLVTNGVASPTYLGAVSTTGAATDPVICNGSGWVYGG